MPIYQLSFYKAHVKMQEKLIKIQRNFLWQGNEDKREISWVSWKDICREKSEGGWE